MLHGFIFTYFVGPSTQPGWNTWQETLSIPEEKGGFYAAVASFTALGVSPIIILFKLGKSSEFEMTPRFRATMRTLIRQRLSYNTQTHVLYYFWTIMYAGRAFIMVMYLAFTNAVLTVD